MSKKLTLKEVQERIINLSNGEYEMISKTYKNVDTKVEILHKKCGQIYMASPAKFFKGRRCRYCNGNFVTPKEFKKRVYEMYNGEYELLSEYEKTDKHVLIKHTTCGNIYKVTPNNFTSGTKCPYCSDSIKSVGGSKGEKLIKKYLIENNIQFIQEANIGLKSPISNKALFFDFIAIINGEMLAIEYNGKQHYHYQGFENHGGIDEQMLKDSSKKAYCKTKNIPLLIIPYTYNKYEDIQSILDKFLNITKSKIKKIFKYSCPL